MEIINEIKEWSGVAVLVAGTLWGIAEVYFKWRKAGENAKQETQTTEQSKLATEEKSLDLDHRRVEAAEEVASKYVEKYAERSEEILKLMEDKHELSKAVVDLRYEMKSMKDEIIQLKEEKYVACFFFCRKAYLCPDKDPVFGPYQFDAATLEALKKIIENGKKA